MMSSENDVNQLLFDPKIFPPQNSNDSFWLEFLLVGIFRCKRYEQANREAYKELFDFFCEL